MRNKSTAFTSTDSFQYSFFGYARLVVSEMKHHKSTAVTMMVDSCYSKTFQNLRTDLQYWQKNTSLTYYNTLAPQYMFLATTFLECPPSC
jgi:hypothetical protein